MVITGPSGSGKSSLAFDTLYAEGQRQYIESLSVYARQFLHQLERPDVDLIEGLQPTLCIDQRPGSQSAQHGGHRHGDLRLPAGDDGPAGRRDLLPVRRPIGSRPPSRFRPRCWDCRRARGRCCWRPSSAGGGAGTRMCWPRSARPGLCGSGSTASCTTWTDCPNCSSRQVHDIDAVVDRIVVRPGLESRLAESLRLAVRHGEGVVIVCYQARPAGPDAADGVWRDWLFSTSTPARTAGSASRNWSRARSASTARTEPVRAARGWAGWSSSTRSWCCPTWTCRWRGRGRSVEGCEAGCREALSGAAGRFPGRPRLGLGDAAERPAEPSP